MRCPYCVTEIHNDALVCPACQRDLYLFQPLLAKINELEGKVAQHEAMLSQIAIATAENEAQGNNVPPEEDIDDTNTRFPSLTSFLTICLGSLMLLITAHVLITIVYDLNTLYLRIVSLLIPLPFGFALTKGHRSPGWFLTLCATALALASTLAMSGITAIVDSTTVLPVGIREWREFIEYSASIAFSFTTGFIVGNMLRRSAQRKVHESNRTSLVQLVTSSATKTEQIKSAAIRFHDLGSSLTAAASTAAAIYTGLQGFLSK